jgi:hypothetical protein
MGADKAFNSVTRFLVAAQEKLTSETIYWLAVTEKQTGLSNEPLRLRDSWLPSILEQLRILGHVSRNRLEGFFGPAQQGTN